VACYDFFAVVFVFFFFFFQAEDGIRDDLVTGVQTCALPISNCCRRRSIILWRNCCGSKLGASGGGPFCARAVAMMPGAPENSAEIGRASCRERVESGEGGIRVKEQRESK